MPGPKGDAQWRVLYGELQPLLPGDRLTMARMQELLPGVSMQGVRAAFQVAVKRFQDSEHRTVRSVRGVGYEVVSPSEHYGLAETHTDRARRSLGRAVEVIASADRAGMSRDERRAADALEHHLRATQSMTGQVFDREALRGGLRSAPVVVAAVESGVVVDVDRLRERGLIRRVAG